MNSKDQTKHLKAFAKRRQTRPEVPVTPAASDREKRRVECLEVVTQAILGIRRDEPKLRDTAVMEALRYELREPGAKQPANDLVYRAIETVRTGYQDDASLWRSALKALLGMSDPVSTQNRNPTQLLDLIETLSR